MRVARALERGAQNLGLLKRLKWGAEPGFRMVSKRGLFCAHLDDAARGGGGRDQSSPGRQGRLVEPVAGPVVEALVQPVAGRGGCAHGLAPELVAVGGHRRHTLPQRV